VKLKLDKEGPVHQCEWNPNGSEFVVIYGFMPPKTCVYDTTCEKKAQLYPECAPRNTAQYSPCGQILCVAGFGNLTGIVDFWHTSKYVKIGACKSRWASYYGWSPDSRFFMTAVLSPKMTVDNGIQIFGYDGKVVYEENFKKLNKAVWQPAPTGSFPSIKVVAPKQPILEEKKLEFYVPPNLARKPTQQPQKKKEGHKLHRKVELQVKNRHKRKNIRLEWRLRKTRKGAGKKRKGEVQPTQILVKIRLLLIPLKFWKKIIKIIISIIPIIIIIKMMMMMVMRRSRRRK